MTTSPNERRIEQLTRRVDQLEARERARGLKNRRVRQVALAAGLVLLAVAGLMPWYARGDTGYPLTESAARLAAYDLFLVVVPLAVTVLLGLIHVCWGSDRFRLFVAVPATVGALGTAIVVLDFQGIDLEEWERALAAGPWVGLLGFVLVAVSQWLAEPDEWDRRQWQ